MSDIQYSEDILNNEINESQMEAQKKLAIEARNNAAFDLDKALDTFDPTFPRYTPSAHALDMINMMTLVNGGDQEFPSPIAHFFMADLLLNAITDPMVFPYSEEICKTININHLRLAFMASRGIAKSTVVISFFGVYSAIKGILPNGIGKVWFYLVLGASSRGGARTNALAVKAMCEDSTFIKDYFERVEYTESETRFLRKGTGPEADRSFLIRYQGIGTGVRGTRAGQRRICAVILDDIILNEAAAYSPTIVSNLESLIHSDIIAALKGGGKGRVIATFTPFNYTDVNTRLVLEGAYTPCVIPLASAFDVEDPKLKAKDIHSSWEAMHPAKTVIQMIKEAAKSHTTSKFLQERMLRLTSSKDRLIPDSCIQWYSLKNIVKNIDKYNIYVTTDYTTTSGENSDFSGIATWALNNNEDWFLLNLTLRKRGMEEQYSETFNEVMRWMRKDKYVEVGVEIDGNQSAHVYSLEKEMMKKGTYFQFARQKGDHSGRKGILSRKSGVSKHERFRVAASQFLLPKKMWFPEELKDTPDMVEFIAQIKGATHENFTRHDDGPDLISQLTLIEATPGGIGAAPDAVTDLTTASKAVWGGIFDKDAEKDTSSVIF